MNWQYWAAEGEREEDGGDTRDYRGYEGEVDAYLVAGTKDILHSRSGWPTPPLSPLRSMSKSIPAVVVDLTSLT